MERSRLRSRKTEPKYLEERAVMSVRNLKRNRTNLFVSSYKSYTLTSSAQHDPLIASLGCASCRYFSESGTSSMEFGYAFGAKLGFTIGSCPGVDGDHP